MKMKRLFRTKSEWQDIYRRVEARRAAGEQLTSILKDEGIPHGSYRNVWNRFNAPGSPMQVEAKPKSSAGFTKFVSSERQHESDTPIVIRHPSGYTIEVSASHLREVLEAL